MTNKKLKMAAMSVALTACVAASPLAANADAPEAAPKEMEKEPAAEEIKKEENTAEHQDNKRAENAQETLKGAEVKYDKEHPTTNPDGSQKLDGVIVTEGSGETDPKPNPNPDSGETDPKPNPNPDSGETDPKPNPNPDSGDPDPNPNPNPDSGETDTEEKKPEQIGKAEKTEKTETTVETKPDPGAEPIVDTTTPPTVEKNPDGSTTITQSTLTPGTETTTTTGTGEAKGDLKEKVEEFKEINLDKELGEKPNISWDIKKGDEAVNDYKVEEVTNSEDGNQQTLKLKKVEETNAEMTAEDIAKLVDAEKPTVNPDGTYTLTRTETILDAEGNPQTRTTYITIRDNKVTTKTTTELTITRKKEERDGSERFDFEVKYPEITVTNTEKPEDKQTISPKLLDTILSQNPKDDGSYEYTDSNGQKYEVKVDGTAEKLTNAEIVARLQKDGHTEYTLGADGKTIYYTTPHNEKVKLDVTQNELLRRSITYTVTLTTTKENGEGNVGKDEAEAEAKKAAIQNALTTAVDRLDVDDDTKAKLKDKINPDELNLNGGTFEVKLEDGKKYTLTYSAAEAKVTASIPTKDTTDISNPENVKDVKDNTVTGTAYVTGSKITYLDSGKYETTGMGTLGIGENFNTKPEGATEVKTDPNTGRITSYKDKDGKTYRFTYEDGVDLNDLDDAEKAALEAAAKQEGWNTEILAASLTRVKWTVMSPEGTKTETEDIQNGTPVDLSEKTWSSQNGNNETVDFTHDNTTYTGMKLESTSEDGKTRTYKKTDDDNTVTIITVTTQQLGEEEIKAKFGNNFISLNLDDKTVTYTGEDGKTYTASYVAQEEKLTVEVQTPDAVAGTGSTEKEAREAFLQNLEKARQEAEDAGEKLVIEYKENGEVKYLTVTKETKWEDITNLVGHVVNYNAMTDAELVEYLNKLETTAKKDGKFYDGSASLLGTTPYYWDANNQMMKRVPKGITVQNDGIIIPNYYVMINDVRYAVRYDDNYIEHLDLATDSKLTLSEKEKDGTAKIDDCVLVNPKLEWNYSAENLLADQNALAPKNRNKNVGLDNKISYDKSGHYEYERGKNKHPDKSAFYKVTGTVAYDAVKENGKVKLFTYQEEAVKAYLTAVEYGKTYEQLNEKEKQEILSTYVVQLGPTRNNSSSPKGYHVYKKSSTMTAYGYMSDDNNTCGNALFEPGSKYNYVGGYDLTLGDLTQTDEKHVVAMGKNTTALSATFMRTKKLQPLTNKELNYTPKFVTETIPVPGTEIGSGKGLSGSYRANYTKTADYRDEQQQGGIEGHGTDSYKSFTNLIRNIFKGEDTGTVEGGSIEYKYHSERDKEGNPVKFEAEEMVVTTKQDAEVHYTFTSQESRDVWIKGYTQTVVPPVNPGPDSPELPPVEDAKPAPAPEAPVLPVVQDARPDPAPTPAPAPETPVLPAVQDAKLIQTGTSGWLADLMLGAGAVLSAAGYWMERKRKAMFYKSQH